MVDIDEVMGYVLVCAGITFICFIWFVIIISILELMGVII